MLTKKKINLRLISQILFHHHRSDNRKSQRPNRARPLRRSCFDTCRLSVRRGRQHLQVRDGSFVRRYTGLVLVDGDRVFSAVLFGPVFCSWVCPFGSFQEQVGKLGRRFFGRRYNSLVREGGQAPRLLEVPCPSMVICHCGKRKAGVFHLRPLQCPVSFWTSVQLTAVAILILVILASLFVKPWCSTRALTARSRAKNLVSRFLKASPTAYRAASATGLAYEHQSVRIDERKGHQVHSCMEYVGISMPVKETVELTANFSEVGK